MFLEDWIKTKDRKSKKYIITDNIANVNILLDEMTHNGKVIENTEVVNIEVISKDIVTSILAIDGDINRFKMMSIDMGAFVLESIIKKNPQDYSFVPKESLCIKTSREILNNLNLIRMNETKGDFESIVGLKTKELVKLVNEFEKEIENQGFYDYTRLVKLSIESLKNNSAYKLNGEVCSLFFDRLSTKEKELVELVADNVDSLIVDLSKSEANIHFFKGYGIVNEVNYVVESIKNLKVPFGQVGLIYASSDYEPYIIAAFGQQNIPINFTSGRNIAGYRLVQFIIKILDWAKGGYIYKDLKPLMLNPIIRVEKNKQDEENQYVSMFYEFTKGIEDGIGWGLDRYIDFVKRYTEDKDNFVGFKKHTDEYVQFISDLINLFIGIEKREIIDVAGLFSELIYFSYKYTSNNNEELKYLKGLLRDELKNLYYVDEVYSLTEAIDLIIDVLNEMSICEEEESNAISAYTINGLRIMDRPYQYVIGLADKFFAMNMTESPVLLDDEREACFELEIGNVPLAKERANKKNQYYSDSFLTLKKGEIFLGCSTYDTIDLLPLSPSALYLNLMEKEEVNDDMEVFGYPNVVMKDSIVKSEQLFEPVKNENMEKVAEVDLTFSTSALDMLVSCPLCYHYAYERKIASEEYLTPDSVRWLPSNEKGNLVHYILHDYVAEEFMGVDSVKNIINEELYEAIVDKRVEEMKIKIPSESEALVKTESNDIRNSLKKYLIGLHEEFSLSKNKWQVIGCEKIFGKNEDDEYKKQYEEKDVIFNLSFNGVIDRLDYYTDKEGHNHYRIVDYKSGKKANFEKDKLGMTSQHSVYKGAIENIGIVEEFDYIFPLENDSISLMGPEIEDKVEECISRIFDVVIERKYNVEGSGCEYCSFKDICIKEAE